MVYSSFVFVLQIATWRRPPEMPPGASWVPPGGLLGSPGGLLGPSWRLQGDLGLQKASKSEACWPEYTLLRRFLMVSKSVPFSRKRAKVRKPTLLRRILHIL